MPSLSSSTGLTTQRLTPVIITAISRQDNSIIDPVSSVSREVSAYISEVGVIEYSSHGLPMS